jgi:hypothetical protein
MSVVGEGIGGGARPPPCLPSFYLRQYLYFCTSKLRQYWYFCTIKLRQYLFVLLYLQDHEAVEVNACWSGVSICTFVLVKQVLLYWQSKLHRHTPGTEQVTAGLRASSEQIIQGSLDSAKSVSGDITCHAAPQMPVFAICTSEASTFVLVKRVARERHGRLPRHYLQHT